MLTPTSLITVDTPLPPPSTYANADASAGANIEISSDASAETSAETGANIKISSDASAETRAETSAVTNAETSAETASSATRCRLAARDQVWRALESAVDTVAATVLATWGGNGVSFTRAASLGVSGGSGDGAASGCGGPMSPTRTATSAVASAGTALSSGDGSALSEAGWHGVVGYREVKRRLERMVVWPMRHPASLERFGVSATLWGAWLPVCCFYDPGGKVVVAIEVAVEVGTR